MIIVATRSLPLLLSGSGEEGIEQKVRSSKAFEAGNGSNAQRGSLRDEAVDRRSVAAIERQRRPAEIAIAEMETGRGIESNRTAANSLARMTDISLNFTREFTIGRACACGRVRRSKGIGVYSRLRNSQLKNTSSVGI